MPLFGPPDIEKLKAKGNIKGLIKALSYKKDDAIRQAAAQVLVEIRLSEDFLEASKKIGDSRAVKPLIVIFNDKDPNVRCSAVKALGKIGNAKAAEPLLAILKDEDSAVREAAAEALVS